MKNTKYEVPFSCNALKYPASSNYFGSDVFLSTSFSNNLSLFNPLQRQPKFHTIQNNGKIVVFLEAAYAVILYLCISIQTYLQCYRMEVKLDGKPKPKVGWYKQGTEVVSSKDFQIEEYEDGISVLTIPEVFPDDTGEITCVAENEFGVASTSTELVVEGMLGIYSHCPFL